MAQLYTYFPSTGEQAYSSSAPIGPSSPGYVQGTANNVQIAPYTQYLPTTDNSGGSGGNPTPNPEPTPTPEPPRPSDEEINSIFNPLFGALGQAESTLRSQLPETQNLINQQANTSREQLGTARTSALGQLGEQRTGANTRAEDAIAASRRLFNELQMGNIQRFGGASSAGQAASELQGRELQRSRGETQRDLGTALRQIDLAQTNVEQEYQTGLQEVENRKQQYLLNAQNEFNQRLLDIQSERGRIESEKAAARLQALQDFRNAVYQIRLQEAQFSQQLAAQREAANTQLSQYKTALTNQAQSGQQAFDTFGQQTTTSPTSQYNLGQTSTSGVQPQYTGQISNKDELYSNLLSPTNYTSSATLR